jgi:hypothetical protein
MTSETGGDNMKKYSAIALMIVLTVSLLAGCRKKQNVPQDTTKAPTPTATTSPTIMPTTPDTNTTGNTDATDNTTGTGDMTNGGDINGTNGDTNSTNVTNGNGNGMIDGTAGRSGF